MQRSAFETHITERSFDFPLTGPEEQLLNGSQYHYASKEADLQVGLIDRRNPASRKGTLLVLMASLEAGDTWNWEKEIATSTEPGFTCKVETPRGILMIPLGALVTSSRFEDAPSLVQDDRTYLFYESAVLRG